MGVRSTQAVTQTVANATDPNVAAYFTFNQRSAGPYNGLVVPFGCAAAGTIFTQHGTPTYGQTGPNGLPAVTFNGTTDFFSTPGNAPAALIPGSSALVIEVMVKATVTGVNQEIVSSFASGIGWGIYIDTIGRPGILLGDGTNLSTDTAGSAGAVTDGNFHYIRMSWPGAGTAPSISFDGNAPVVSSKIINAVNQVANVSIAQLSNNTNRLTGSLANLRVTIGNTTNNLGYNTVANRNKSTQIQKSGQATGDPNVAAYLSFDSPSYVHQNPFISGVLSGPGVLATSILGTPNFGVISGVPAGLGAAVSFDGVSQISCNPTSLIDIGVNDFTIEAWIKVTNGATFCGIYTHGGYAVIRAGALIGINVNNEAGLDGKPQFMVSNGTIHHGISGQNTINDGQWHLWRATWKNSTGTQTLFIDNQQVATNTDATMIGTSLTSVRNIWFGGGDGGGGIGSGGFQGQVADLRISVGNTTNNLGFVTSGARGSPGSSSPVSKQTPGNVTDPNVAVYLSMDQGSGNLTVPAGCTAAGSVFTAHGSPKYGQSAPAGLGTAITFNGTTDYFDAGDVVALNGSNSMVVEGWINIHGHASGRQVIASKFAAAGGPGWFIDTGVDDGSHLRFLIDDGVNIAQATVANLLLDTWMYFRAVNNGTTLSLALNGGTPATASATAVGSLVTTAHAIIGNRDALDGYLNGSIADLRITIGNTTNQSGYAVPVLTPTVVQRPGNVTDPNVAAYFNMDQAGGNLVVPAGCSLAGVVASKQGSPVYGITAGVPNGLGKAIQFVKATSDRFQNASASSFLGGATGLGTQDMVVEFWAQTPAPSGSHEFITQGGYFSGPFGSGGFYAIILNGVMSVSVSSTTVAPVASVSASYPQDTNWHYWRVTWKNSTGTLTFYLDDVLQGTTQVLALAGVDCTSTRQFRIGLSLDQAIGLDGQIADIRITFGNTTNRSGYNSSGRAPTY